MNGRTKTRLLRDFLSVKQAATLLGLPAYAIANAIAQCRLDAVKVGNSYLLYRPDVVAWGDHATPPRTAARDAGPPGEAPV
jgi:excisionase family DNA binding protein